MTDTPIRIAIIGLGKIARDQHIPSIRANRDFELAAVASPNSKHEDVPNFDSLEQLLQDGPPVDAVAVCTPPSVRLGIALAALAAGKATFLEKPPGATLGEVDVLAAAAARANMPLFASWHSREAAGVAPARDWAGDRRIVRAAVRWREDVRKWHPGQDWVFEAGNFGVFDPGINGLSALTAILSDPIFPTKAELSFPANRDGPIAAEAAFTDGHGLQGSLSLDWRHTDGEEWSIDLTDEHGETLELRDGAGRIEGHPTPTDADGHAGEYPGLYRRFAELVRARRSDVDPRPLRFVADCFLLGRRVQVDPFSW